MTVPHTTESTFQADVLESDRPVVVDFTAAWCGPCRAMAPILDTLAAERDDLRIVKVDADEDMSLTASFGIRGFPTFIVFDRGREVGHIRGAMPKRRFEAELDALLAGVRT